MPFELNGFLKTPAPTPKNKPSQFSHLVCTERDLIGIHEETNRLLFLSSTSDFEEVVSINGHLMRKNQAMTVYSRLVDAHIYLIKRWVLNFLCHNEGFSTLKGELLPYIIRKQLSRPGPGAIDGGDNLFSTTLADEKSSDSDIFSVSIIFRKWTRRSANLLTFYVRFWFSSSSTPSCRPRSAKRRCSTTRAPADRTMRTGFAVTRVGRPKMCLAFASTRRSTIVRPTKRYLPSGSDCSRKSH